MSAFRSAFIDLFKFPPMIRRDLSAADVLSRAFVAVLSILSGFGAVYIMGATANSLDAKLLSEAPYNQIEWAMSIISTPIHFGFIILLFQVILIYLPVTLISAALSIR